MTKFRRSFIWFWMLGKRLLKQWSFVVLLCLIPVLVPMANLAMSEDSGLVHIVLCNEGNDVTAQEMITSLTERDTLARFSVVDSKELATNQVATQKADIAWIFPHDFSQKLDQYSKNPAKEPAVLVVQRESNMTTRIANEMLYSEMFPHLSYDIYRNFSEANVVNNQSVSQEELRLTYDKWHSRDSIVKIEKINPDGTASNIQVNYLNAPIRGLLAIMVLLCTMTAAMYAIKDRQEGRFDWLEPKKRIVPAFGSCLAAAILSSVVMLISLAISNMTGSVINEILATVLLIFTVTGFSLLVSLPFSSYGKFGAVIPGILILSLVLSPIFFNFVQLQNYFRLFPVYYYINGVYQMKYHLWAFVYGGILFGLVFAGNFFLSKRKKQNSVI